MYENAKMEKGNREKEIPVAVQLLGEKIDKQAALIDELQKLLAVVLSPDEPMAPTDETTKDLVGPRTELGGKLNRYCSKIDDSMCELRFMVNHLEL